MSESVNPMQGEVLAPETRMPAVAPSAPPPETRGPTFWVQWRYKSAREKAESYTQFLRSLTDTVTTTAQLERAIEARDTALARLERLGDLREAEHLKIDAEIEGVKAQHAAQRFGNRATLAGLEEQAIAAEQRLARQKEGPKTQEKEEEAVSPVRRAADLIKKLREEHNLIIKEMKEAAGETLTQADEDLIHSMELALSDRINRIIGEMRDA